MPFQLLASTLSQSFQLVFLCPGSPPILVSNCSFMHFDFTMSLWPSETSTVSGLKSSQLHVLLDIGSTQICLPLFLKTNHILYSGLISSPRNKQALFALTSSVLALRSLLVAWKAPSQVSGPFPCKAFPDHCSLQLLCSSVLFFFLTVYTRFTLFMLFS